MGRRRQRAPRPEDGSAKVFSHIDEAYDDKYRAHIWLSLTRSLFRPRWWSLLVLIGLFVIFTKVIVEFTSSEVTALQDALRQERENSEILRQTYLKQETLLTARLEELKNRMQELSVGPIQEEKIRMQMTRVFRENLRTRSVREDLMLLLSMIDDAKNAEDWVVYAEDSDDRIRYKRLQEISPKIDRSDTRQLREKLIEEVVGIIQSE